MKVYPSDSEWSEATAKADGLSSPEAGRGRKNLEGEVTGKARATPSRSRV